MNVFSFLEKLKQSPAENRFADAIAYIDANYNFSPTQFQNGTLINLAGENSGSCKIFAFGLLENSDETQILNCFGTYYSVEVLAYPDGTNHQNIRNFIKTGWEGIHFEGNALVKIQK